jgi:putative methyltransferase (TIGR04325 family)
MKEMLRALCPPMVWRLLRAARRSLTTPAPRMFGGVHRSFAEVVDQHPWSQAGYHDTCRLQLRESPLVLPTAHTAHAVLAVLIDALPADRVPRILDWGGGTGLRFWTTRPALNRSVEWLVVDAPALADFSRQIKGESRELSFAPALPPADSAPFDIVLAYSSLQYVEAQDELLTAFARYRPRYIVLPRLMALSDTSYVTRQVVQGFATPCKVASVAQITATLAAQGYELVLTMRDGLDLSPLFDEGFPDAMRAGQEWLLVFRQAS